MLKLCYKPGPLGSVGDFQHQRGVPPENAGGSPPETPPFENRGDGSAMEAGSTRPNRPIVSELLYGCSCTDDTGMLSQRDCSWGLVA